MIVDLERFVQTEKPFWTELEQMLDRLERDFGASLTLDQAKRFHYLYQRAGSGLSRLEAFPAEPRLRENLEGLVARAYAEIHETREKTKRFSPLYWFFKTFPRTFRAHARAFALALAVTLAGAALGVGAIGLDYESKEVLMPFSHLMGRPAERVKQEESADRDRLAGAKGTFSAYLMTHNTKVSIFVLALGMTWGLGSIILLFYNGVILGAVCMDYVLAGQTKFLAGWLLPHGVIEIPAILIAGQAGLVLGRALIGRGSAESLRSRLRSVSRDLVNLIFGVAALLVWAGIVEAFFSQYHEPALPYSLKIAFGLAELGLLILFLGWSGRKPDEDEPRRGRGA